MDGNNSLYSNSKNDWEMLNQTVIDYQHQSTPKNVFPKYSPAFNPSKYCGSQTYQHLPSAICPPAKVPPPKQSNVQQPFSKRTQEPQLRRTEPSLNTWSSANYSVSKYDPFVEDNVDDIMEISDDEKPEKSENPIVLPIMDKSSKSSQLQNQVEVKSGAAFYKGLILYIPPFEQIANTYRGSPAMKMLYASFEFSFKMPVGIEAKKKENDVMETTVFFQDHVIATGSGHGAHVEASVRALELLSETCYTIQAKEEYFIKCKLVDAENMKTLNLKKWETVCQKYPDLQELAKEHIQKTFSLFLVNHTSTGVYEDIVCCNLSRSDVNNIKSVVEFFHLTMLPCPVSTKLTKKSHPCVVSIHKYTSAQKLLDILIECGGENDKFKVHPPDTFKEFRKLHHNYWDKTLKNRKDNFSTTLDDEELQAEILKPYENTISELFVKHKTLPKPKNEEKEPSQRKAGDDFMKENLKIDVANSKNVAPVERMQLLLKYMEQLQEYGSRVLTSGRPEMIKIYHNAIDNLRKDLDACRKDIEKEQKSKNQTVATRKQSDKLPNRTSRSPLRRKISPRRRSKSPMRRNRPRDRSRSPRRLARVRESLSPRRRPRSKSPQRRLRSPVQRRRSPSPKRPRSPRTLPLEGNVLSSIFKDQLRRFQDSLRTFRNEITNTPIERRNALNERLHRYKDQLRKLYKEVSEKPKKLEIYNNHIEDCRDELLELTQLIENKIPPQPSGIPPLNPPPWMDFSGFESFDRPISYPLPTQRPQFSSANAAARMLPPGDHFTLDTPFDYRF